MPKIEVELSDLQKLLDALASACSFLERRDEMNASVHLAKETRYSPLTVTVQAEVDRIMTILAGA